jgi:hypothetical protein
MSTEELQMWDSYFQSNGSEQDQLEGQFVDLVLKLQGSASPIGREVGNYFFQHHDAIVLSFDSNLPVGNDANTVPATDGSADIELTLNYGSFKGPNQEKSSDLAQVLVHEYVHIREYEDQADKLVASTGISKQQALQQIHDEVDSIFYCGEMQAWAYQTAFYAGGMNSLPLKYKSSFDANLAFLSSNSWNWQSAAWYARLKSINVFSLSK